MKKVYKYPTGGEIPEGAVYLCTQVETMTHEITQLGESESTTHNALVWHYFLVEVPHEPA